MKTKKGGKAVIVKDLMATGLSARKAAKALNAVLDSMKFALWCGEPVEIPGGSIQAKTRKGTPRREFHRFRNVQTREIDHHIVAYSGLRHVVTFTADSELDLTPLPLPETPEQVEALQLASELLGKPADEAIIAQLQQAAEVHPRGPGALLRRLRDIKSRGWQFHNDVHSLARQVAAHYWL
jgi:nucleoid DNA-binding protein